MKKLMLLIILLLSAVFSVCAETDCQNFSPTAAQINDAISHPDKFIVCDKSSVKIVKIVSYSRAIKNYQENGVIFKNNRISYFERSGSGEFYSNLFLCILISIIGYFLFIIFISFLRFYETKKNNKNQKKVNRFVTILFIVFLFGISIFDALILFYFTFFCCLPLYAAIASGVLLLVYLGSFYVLDPGDAVEVEHQYVDKDGEVKFESEIEGGAYVFYKDKKYFIAAVSLLSFSTAVILSIFFFFLL